MKVFVLGLLISLPAFGGATLQQCKQLCKSHLKPECEAVCRKQPKKYVESCLHQMCELAMTKCDAMCEEKSKQK